MIKSLYVVYVDNAWIFLLLLQLAKIQKGRNLEIALRQENATEYNVQCNLL